MAVDAVQDAPIEVGGTVEEIETTSPVEAALPVTPSEERAEPSPLKVEASVGPETIATEAVSVEVANSPHQEPRSGVPVSLVVILVLITALFASIFAFVWNSNQAGEDDAEGVPTQNVSNEAVSVTGRAVLNETSAAAVPCYNLAMSEPAELSGSLEYVMFAGPPNYEDVQKGDMPEPSFILRLNKKICISDDEGFAEPDVLFDQVQIVPGNVGSAELRTLVGQFVTVALYDQMAAHTAHHRKPLVAWVSKISTAPISSKHFSNKEDPTEDYGTAATTIRAFYSALGSGEGGVAANLVVPEKTASGPFSEKELTRYYGNMKSPIKLISVSSTADDAYIVHYKFTVNRSMCNGRAVVYIENRNGKNYISRIKALDGC